MTAHFDEFEEEMTSRSLERAYDYVDEHRIGGLEEVSAGLFHAEVHGSELYDVDIATSWQRYRVRILHLPLRL